VRALEPQHGTACFQQFGRAGGDLSLLKGQLTAPRVVLGAKPPQGASQRIAATRHASMQLQQIRVKPFHSPLAFGQFGFALFQCQPSRVEVRNGHRASWGPRGDGRGRPLGRQECRVDRIEFFGKSADRCRPARFAR
jgi:hypothetical protein